MNFVKRGIKAMENRYYFRAKRIDNGEWVYGAVLFHDSDAATIFNQHPADGSLQGFEVNIKTICQCTGLKDKNGKLIFENDIMEAHLDDEFPEDISRFKIEWLDNGWVVNQPGCVDREYISDFETETYEVCGNTFDNPELLEGGAE